MEWSKEITLQFLKAYHSEVITWNPSHKIHKSKWKVNGVDQRYLPHFWYEKEERLPYSEPLQ